MITLLFKQNNPGVVKALLPPLDLGEGVVLLQGKSHIGEVRSSCWDEGTMARRQEAGIVLL